jgi:hypothetical protein
VAKFHPDMLVHFKNAWSCLTEAMRQDWLEKGLCIQGLRNPSRASRWQSWIQVALELDEKYHPYDHKNISQRSHQLPQYIAQKMEHEGVFHGLPEEPYLHTNTAPASSVRTMIAMEVVDTYLKSKIAKIVKETKLAIDNEGVGVMKKLLEELDDDDMEM